MSALASFQASMPTWRPAVERWIEQQPIEVRTDPARAGTEYLLTSPPLERLGSRHLSDRRNGWVDWPALAARADADGDVSRVLVRATGALAGGDPGPALALMLLAPQVLAFHWAHAAGTVFGIVAERLRWHPLVPA